MKNKLPFTLLLALGALAFATHDIHAVGGRPLAADLSGAAEAPGPGDPDGSGMANIHLNQGQGVVLFEILVSDIGDVPPIAAHIHVGEAGSPGPVVVPLNPTFIEIDPGVYFGTGEIQGVDKELIKAIRQNPAGYYVNVHTTAFPAGAVRGQLSK